MALKFEKLSMLVVEDTNPMQKLLVSVLETLGIRNIYTSTNGEEAFRSFCLHNQDIILSDWQMEPMDGISLTRQIRTHQLSPNKMVPVILITGYSAWQRVQDARDAGVTEFLVKPFTAHDLARRIAHVINRPRDFIETQDFFGPNRRRHTAESTPYNGPRRRSEDMPSQSSQELDISFRRK